jgi:hypothetical protein
MRRVLACGLGLAVLLSAPTFAHHSAVMFDDQKEITVTGTVKEFQYTNPHSWLLVDVKNDDGTVTTWGFEAEGPSTLTRAGIRKSDFAQASQSNNAGVLERRGPSRQTARAFFFFAQRAEQGCGSQPLRSVCLRKLLLVIGEIVK